MKNLVCVLAISAMLITPCPKSMGLPTSMQTAAPTQGCRAGDPEGYFEGFALSREAGRLNISLNLRCAGGSYQGEMVTPVGTFPLKRGAFEAGKLQITFDSGGETGTLEATVESGLLRGKFVLGGDRGLIEVKRVGSSRQPGISEPTLNLTKEQWREDLKLFAAELPKRHANAFNHTSREQFEREVAKLDSQIGSLDGDEMYVGLDRLANLIGDGHTYVRFPPDHANFPIDITKFGDEYRVTSVASGTESALGGRVLKIDDTPVGRARELLLPLTPANETSLLAEVRVEGFLTVGMLLHGAGIIKDRNTVRYTLADDSGKEFTIQVKAVPPSESAKLKWVQVFKEPPLYRQKPGNAFWYEYLPESRTVYCSFRGYNNLAANATALFHLLSQEHPERLVIDIRLNGGGDYEQGLKYLVRPIAELHDINRKGHLFVLIGPYTFSAAMSNSAHFRFQTAAILVGRPIGETPNSYQEGRETTLPNSRLVLRYSVKYYKFVESGDNIIRPDKEIIPSWSDYKAGRDPVLDWVLKYHD
jgi:hypothetical protein